MRDREIKPLDKAIYWIEYIARHQGAQHLRYPGINLYWYQRYLVDVVLLVFTMMCIFISVLYVICLKCQNIGKNPQTAKKVKKTE